MKAHERFRRAKVLLSLLGLIVSFLLMGHGARAQTSGDDLRVSGFRVQEDTERSDFLLGIETGSMTINGSRLNAFGGRLGLDYYLNPDWSMNVNLALVYQTNPMAFLYSGFNGMMRYNFFHSNLMSKRDVYYNEKPVVLETSSRASKLLAMVGIEQLFLNGSANIYPAAGPTFGVGYVQSIFGTWTEISLRYSTLTANNVPVQVMYLNISIPFGI